MTVYAWDSGRHNVVRIEKHGKNWCVYLLEKVELTNKHPRFTFTKRPCEHYSYQPFEDKDVTGDVEKFLEDIKRWRSCLIVQS